MAVLGLFGKPKKAKSKRSALKKALDVEMSKQVRERDKHRCRRCGKEKVYAHHLFGKGAHSSTRWNLDNLLSLCFFCHRSAHASPEDFRRWVLSWMGETEYENLYIKAQMRTSFKEVDLQWLLVKIRADKNKP